MAEDIYIRIKTLLEKASPTEVAKLQKDIQTKMQPIQVKVSADTKNLDKFSQTTKKMAGEADYISEKTKQWTQNLGTTVIQTEKLDKATGNIKETATKTLINYKDMNKIHGQALVMNEKINQSIKNQSLAQKDMLTTIKGIYGKDTAFITDENLKRLQGIETTVRKLDPASKNFANSMRVAKSEIKAVNTDIGIYKKQVQDANKYTNIFGQSIVEVFKKFGSWMLVGGIVVGFLQQIRQGIQDLKDIDEQLVQLRKVTGENVEVMRDYAFVANEVASRMGATTAEVIEQTVAWSRLGYSIRDASKLAEESILLSVVGNMSVERATTALISTLKAFNMEANNARVAIDAINEVNLLLAS